MQQLVASELLTPSRHYDYSKSQSPLNEQSQSYPTSQILLTSKLIKQSSPNNKRQLQNLYNNICTKQLSSKQLLRQIKSTNNISLQHTYHKLQGENVKEIRKQENKYRSLQQQISLSNYKKLLSSQCDSGYVKDRRLNILELKYNEKSTQNQRLKQQNQRLSKTVIELKTTEKKDLKIYQQLDRKYRQLQRNYNNLIQQSTSKQHRYRNELKKSAHQNQKYQKLIKGLKESIRILKGKEVHQINQIWKEWKSIFQLASMQQCKLRKSMNKL